MAEIRTAQDAHRVFEAVRQGILPLIRRRLSPSERDLLASGQVFVWEEAPTGAAAGDEISQTTSGLERWTDEKVQTTAEERQAKADRRARKASSSDSQSLPGHLLPIRRQDRPSKPDGLTKQTYS
ncbi:16790_t:CDS:2, partial [Acaulospora colombiana]